MQSSITSRIHTTTRAEGCAQHTRNAPRLQVALAALTLCANTSTATTAMRRLFPLLRQDVMEAYEFAARLGDRDRKGLQPLSPPKLATALKYLGVLDGKRVTRAEVDLLYINLTKDLTGTAGKARDAADGVTLDMFGRALHAIAARLCPAAKTGVEAVCQMLEDCTRGRTAFDRGEE